MCHEVRTPLNGCLASAEMLLETPLAAEQRELAATIRVSGSILLSTVSNFLDFFKLEAGKALDIVRTATDLRRLVAEVHCIVEAMVRGCVCVWGGGLGQGMGSAAGSSGVGGYRGYGQGGGGWRYATLTRAHCAIPNLARGILSWVGPAVLLGAPGRTYVHPPSQMHTRTRAHANAQVGRGGEVALLEPHLDGPLAAGGRPVYCDADRVRGILLNLYTNAAKFTKAGHIQLRVREVPPGYAPEPAPGYSAIVVAPPTYNHHHLGGGAGGGGGGTSGSGGLGAAGGRGGRGGGGGGGGVGEGRGSTQGQYTPRAAAGPGAYLNPFSSQPQPQPQPHQLAPSAASTPQPHPTPASSSDNNLLMRELAGLGPAPSHLRPQPQAQPQALPETEAPAGEVQQPTAAPACSGAAPSAPPQQQQQQQQQQAGAGKDDGRKDAGGGGGGGGGGPGLDVVLVCDSDGSSAASSAPHSGPREGGLGLGLSGAAEAALGAAQQLTAGPVPGLGGATGAEPDCTSQGQDTTHGPGGAAGGTATATATASAQEGAGSEAGAVPVGGSAPSTASSLETGPGRPDSARPTHPPAAAPQQPAAQHGGAGAAAAAHSGAHSGAAAGQAGSGAGGPGGDMELMESEPRWLLFEVADTGAASGAAHGAARGRVDLRPGCPGHGTYRALEVLHSLQAPQSHVAHLPTSVALVRHDCGSVLCYQVASFPIPCAHTHTHTRTHRRFAASHTLSLRNVFLVLFNTRTQVWASRPRASRRCSGSTCRAPRTRCASRGARAAPGWDCPSAASRWACWAAALEPTQPPAAAPCSGSPYRS
mgnify:CR=1 FL=1